MKPNDKISSSADQSGSGSRATQLHGHPTILIADDDDLIREVTSLMIEENGGEAVSVRDGEECVEAFRQRSKEIALLVVDYSMPKRNGTAVYDEVTKIKSDIPVLFISGLRLDAELQAVCAKPHVAFLGKPFREAEFIRSINALLDRKPN